MIQHTDWKSVPWIVAFCLSGSRLDYCSTVFWPLLLVRCYCGRLSYIAEVQDLTKGRLFHLLWWYWRYYARVHNAINKQPFFCPFDLFFLSPGDQVNHTYASHTVSRIASLEPSGCLTPLNTKYLYAVLIRPVVQVQRKRLTSASLMGCGWKRSCIMNLTFNASSSFEFATTSGSSCTITFRSGYFLASANAASPWDPPRSMTVPDLTESQGYPSVRWRSE